MEQLPRLIHLFVLTHGETIEFNVPDARIAANPPASLEGFEKIQSIIDGNAAIFDDLDFERVYSGVMSRALCAASQFCMPRKSIFTVSPFLAQHGKKLSNGRVVMVPGYEKESESEWHNYAAFFVRQVVSGTHHQRSYVLAFTNRPIAAALMALTNERQGEDIGKLARELPEGTLVELVLHADAENLNVSELHFIRKH